jgi:hypothetical protein
VTIKSFPRLGGPLHSHSRRRLASVGGGPGRRRGGSGRRNCRRTVEQPSGRSSCGNWGAVPRRHDFVRGRLRPPAPPHDFSNRRCWLGFAPLSDFATEIFDATLGNAFSKAMALKFDLGQVGQDSARKRRSRRFGSWRLDFRGLDRGRDSKRFSAGRGQRELRFDPPQIRARSPPRDWGQREGGCEGAWRSRGLPGGAEGIRTFDLREGAVSAPPLPRIKFAETAPRDLALGWRCFP